MPPLEIVLRSLGMVLALLVLTRIVGKPQVSQLTLFEFIAGITIGSIAAAASTDKSMDFSTGLISLATWMTAILLLSFLALKSRYAAKLLRGEPSIVIYKGKILEDVMSKIPNYTIDELWEQLRQKNVTSIKDVEVAIMETSGKLSVIKSADAQPPTARDMRITPSSPTGLNIELVKEGEIIETNFEDAGISQEVLFEALRRAGIQDVKEVFYAALQPDNTIFIDRYKDDTKPPDPTDFKWQLEKL